MQTNLKNNSNFFARLEQIIDSYGLKNVSGLAKRLHYSSPEKLNRLKKEDAKPSFDILRDISNEFENLSLDWLITGVEPMHKTYENPMIVSEPIIKYNLPKVVTVDKNKEEFISKLPTYRMPGLNNGTFRAFEVKGQSMNLTLHNKSYAIGEWVEDWNKNIKDDRVYIIVHEDWDNDEEGILVKRCLNRIEKYNNLICKSDNLDRRAYPNINLEPSTIREVWEVKGALIFEFTNPSLIFDRMNNLEADMEEIKKHIL